MSSWPAPVRSPIAGSLIDSATICVPAATCAGSTSATGKPLTGLPLAFHAYRCPSRLGSTMSGFLLKPSRCASAGEAKKPHFGWLCAFSSAGPQKAGFSTTGKPCHRLAVGLPRVDVGARRRDHVGAAVAGEVADQRRARRLVRQPQRGEPRRARCARAPTAGLRSAPASPSAPCRSARRRGCSRPRSARSAPARCCRRGRRSASALRRPSRAASG